MKTYEMNNENYEMNNENYEMNEENVETKKSNKFLPVAIGGGVALLAAHVAWKKIVRPKLVKAAAGILRDAQKTIDAEFEESKYNGDSKCDGESNSEPNQK